jgi:hypothetical protein
MAGTVTTLANLLYTGPFHGMGHGTLTYVKSDRTAF